MVGGRLSCRNCFLTYSIVLLLRVCLQYAEASNGRRVIHKKIGDTVELSSGLSPQGVNRATWNFGETIVADKDVDFSKTSQFRNRSELNPNNFTLTLKNLTLQDSGNFSFISEVNDKQRGTVFITLQVHEPITNHPVIKILNSTWEASNESCTVLLECSATGSVTYNWTVGSQIQTGPVLRHTFWDKNGEMNVTCTVSSFFTEKSTFKRVKCDKNKKEEPVKYPLILGVAGGCLLLVIIFAIAVGVSCCKKRHAGSDTNDLTVYADIGDLTIEDGNVKPCSLYETVDNRSNSVSPRTHPQTVYDKIQLNRVRKISVSPYQEVS